MTRKSPTNPHIGKNSKPRVRGALSAKVYRFVQEYLVDLNGTQAAIRAGYSRRSARFTARDLLAREDVSSVIAADASKRSQRLEIEQDAVLRRLWLLATADAGELVAIKYFCCRYCYGKGHRYQYVENEMEDARVAWKAAHPDSEPFDERGGIGFDGTKSPHPDCPECFSQGIMKVVVAGTDTLSESGKLLYAGAKETAYGIEVRMHDRDAALIAVARHLGMFKDTIEHTGKNGAPLSPLEQAMLQALDAATGADTGIGPSTSRARLRRR